MVEWFYGKEGQQYGPIDEATLRARITTGEVGPRDLIWTEGMDKWTPLQELPQFTGGEASPAAPTSGDPGTPPGGGLASPYAPPSANLAGAYPQGPGGSVTNGLAIASLVCGILSLVFFCFCGGLFFGVPAIICGHLGLNQLNTPGNTQQGRSLAMAGLICGYIGMGIFLLMMIGGNVNARWDGM